MKELCKPIINVDHNARYPYNVQLFYSYDGGKNYYYTGFGRFFKTSKEAEEYANWIKSTYNKEV